jgi:alpha-1,3-rhamnosyl/mannosyltransferase
MPEVADGAAILFDPYSISEMVRAMADILLDSELRARLERLGMQRAAHFSWEHAASKTLEVYYQVAGGGYTGHERPIQKKHAMKARVSS